MEDYNSTPYKGRPGSKNRHETFRFEQECEPNHSCNVFAIVRIARNGVCKEFAHLQYYQP